MKKSSFMTIIPTVICAIALIVLGYYCGKTKIRTAAAACSAM